MNLIEFKKVISTKIAAIAEAEKITKVKLAELSRDILTYINVNGSTDIGTVNRLLNVLTPMNRQAAELYFQHFLPYAFEDGKFGKKLASQKKVDAKLADTAAWLEDEANNIWTWVDNNIEVKAKDYAADIEKAIKAALKGNEKKGYEALTVSQVLTAVVSTEGIEMADLVAFMAAVADMQENKAVA